MNKMNVKTLLVLSLFLQTLLFSAGAFSYDSDVLNLVGKDDEVDKYWVNAYRAPPVYPRRAQEQGIGGCAEFSFVISNKGMPESIKLIRSAPEKLFVKSARQALEQYRWLNAQSNAQKRSVKTVVKIRFEMEKGSPYSNFDCDGEHAVTEEVKPPRILKGCSTKTNSRLLKKCEYE